LQVLSRPVITLSAILLMAGGAAEAHVVVAQAQAPIPSTDHARAFAPPTAALAATPAATPAAPPTYVKDEHYRPVPAMTGQSGARLRTTAMNQMHSELVGRGGLPTSPSRAAQPLQAASSSNQFLTRPYLTWHTITSVFDHCNPDYTHDGRVCEFDGSVGLSSNGVDPSFSQGYAQTRGGSDYLYYDGHNGWDYALAYENVLAAAPGTVTLAGIDSVNPCFGQNVLIDHGNGFTTRYAHLSQIAVSVGQAVDRAQIVGQSGNTGCSSGPHLHFGVYITSSWTAVDPWGWSGAPGADPWPSDPGSLWLTGSAQFPLPTAATNVRAISGNASATVSWSPPSFDGGTGIVYYVVTPSPTAPTVTVAGNVTSAVVTGLSNGTAYSFTVASLTKVGWTPSGASNAITPSAWIGQFRALAPARILDTRNNIGGIGTQIRGGQTVNLAVVGTGGVPASGVAAVILNVTVTGAGGPGYLTLFPTGSLRPQSSSINYRAGDTVANLVQAPVGTGGYASIFVGGAAVHVIADVAGYYTSDVSTGNGLYHPLTPARIADSRSGVGLAVAPGPNQAADLQVTGRGGVPSSGVSGIIVNLTATNPTAAGWLSVSPSGVGVPGTSNVNFIAGQTIANRVVTGVGPDGKVTIRNGPGTVQVVVDVVGWFSDASAPAATSGRYLGLLPTRVLDTRSGIGGVGTLNPGQTLATIAGLGGIPPGGAAAVILNLTATNATGTSFLSVYPSNASYPNTSDLNISAGESRANHDVLRLGADGRIAIYNAVGRVDAIIDVAGYYSS
jgi:murein DD-endopeptidase MepM/ murein hydrolase activator NlpD